MKTTTLVLFGIISTLLPATAKSPRNTTTKADYVAHEWGTFTSVQGSDGVQLEWNPLAVLDLPKFVYDVNRPRGRDRGVALPAFAMPIKSAFVSRQRMETPVIYFYADSSQTVDVDVSFPEGRFTEWFPQLAPAAPGAKLTAPAAAFRGQMRWDDVQILPGNGADEQRHFPKEASGSHYYAARETDASAIRVKGPDGTEEYEKFLFYRGVAQFQAPLKVSHWGDHAENIRLQNTSNDQLGRFFIYALRGGKAALMKVPALDGKVTMDVEFPFDRIAKPAAEVRAELARELQTTLVSEGLYPREAEAMIKTWDESWMGESGLRVLYTLPQKWSDQVLPLKLSPAPKALKRVFVGRAELITPAQEWSFLKEVVRYAEGGSLQRREAIANVNQLGLGRFTDAAARRLTASGPQVREFSQAVWNLLESTRPAPKPEPATAGR